MSAVPKLRFPEFEGDILTLSLGQIGTVSMCKRVMKDQTVPSGDIPFFKIGTFGREPDAFIGKELFETLQQKYSYPKKGEILISAAGTIGRLVVFDGKPAYFQDSNIVWLANNGDSVINSYLYQFLLTVQWTTEDTTIARLYNDNLRSIKINAPSLPEQQKIASFLSSVDKKIDLLRQKKDALELYKKGLMQKIFSQEIRFKQKDGSHFPDWEEVYADEILNTVSNKNHDGTGQIVSISQTGGAVYRDQNGIDIIASEESVKNYKIIEAGDFVISLRSFQGGIEYSEIRGICSPAYTVMKPKVDFDAEFFRSFFKTGNFIRRLSLTVVGIRDGKQISFGAFSTVPLPFPSVAEQKKISSFLSAIDAKIQTTSSQIEQMETFKKGLLQQMFV